MTASTSPSPVLFESSRFVVRALARDDVPALQGLFDANPAYFQTVNGRRARPDEAATEYDELPPPHLSFTRRWIAGIGARDDGELAGVVSVLSDLMVPGVWHLGLFLLATGWHGRGAAQEVYAGLEDWMRAAGGTWLRLGVVVGNQRAERFWQRQGFVEVRRREGVDTGGRINTVRVLLKPLAPPGDLAAYLDAVPRDRPGSTLP